MLYEESGNKPIYWYSNADTKKWKLKVHDLLIKDGPVTKEDGTLAPTTYSNVDPDTTGFHYAEAAVDTFYRAVLIPDAIFGSYARLLDKSFNRTYGPV